MLILTADGSNQADSSKVYRWEPSPPGYQSQDRTRPAGSWASTCSSEEASEERNQGFAVSVSTLPWRALISFVWRVLLVGYRSCHYERRAGCFSNHIFCPVDPVATGAILTRVWVMCSGLAAYPLAVVSVPSLSPAI